MSENNKDTNPKQSVGEKKTPMSFTSFAVLQELGIAMLEGGLRYGAMNWRVMGVRSSTYVDACLRHLMAWQEGEDIDPDSGMSHLVKSMACLMILRDSQLMKNLNDDRPPRLPHEPNTLTRSASLNLRASRLVIQTENPKERYTHGNQEEEVQPEA